jgi:hypothetical protein
MDSHHLSPMTSHNHHGFIVTSPTGSVSLREIPVPIHATRDLACKAGRASGKPFIVTTASKFYATSFGKCVRALALKRQREQPINSTKSVEIPKPSVTSPLTNLLNRLRTKKREQNLTAKIKRDTPKVLSEAEKAELATSRLMLETLQGENQSRAKLADHSHLAKAMQAPPPTLQREGLSDSALFLLFNRQTPELQHEIDVSAKFNWTRKRVSLLLRSSSLKNILILFRAGKLPDTARNYRKLAKQFNLI